MEESKLTMMQRKSIQSAVDRGEPLPPPSRPTTSSADRSQGSQVTFPCYWKKRSQNAIASSGAYEREQYRRTAPLRKSKFVRYFVCSKKKKLKVEIFIMLSHNVFFVLSNFTRKFRMIPH